MVGTRTRRWFGRQPRPVVGSRQLRLQLLEGREVPTVFTVTNTLDAGTGSLRQAIINANADTVFDTIQFDPALFGTPQKTTSITIKLDSGPFYINTEFILKGYMETGKPPFVVLDAQNNSRVFEFDIPNSMPSGTTVSSIVITGGLTAQSGGGISINQGRVTLLDCVVSGNSADNGGAIFVHNGQLELSNCVVNTNIASTNGGGIAVDNGGVNAISSIISGNLAGGSGGGIFASTSTVTMNNSLAESNETTATGHGGGLRLENSPTTLTTCTINLNQSRGNGGGISNVTGSLAMTNCYVTGHGFDTPAFSPNRGGGIYSTGPTTMTLCTVSSNIAKFGGGLEVTTNTGSLSMDSCTFDSNRANNDFKLTTQGAGIRLFNISSAKSSIANTAITNCTARSDNEVGDGGGIAIIGSGIVEIKNKTSIKGCFAFGSGGGIFIAGTTTASPVVLMSGVAIGLAPDTITMTDNSNRAHRGGGIAIQDLSTNVTITNCSIEHNLPPLVILPTDGGGGIYISGEPATSGTVLLSNSTINFNISRTGGGIVVENSNAVVTVNGCTVNQNNAEDFGGGIAVRGVTTTPAKIQVNGGTISKNGVGPQFIPKDGGGVYIADTHASVTFNGTTIAGNRAEADFGGGAEITGMKGIPTVRFSNCTIGGPTAEDGNKATTIGGGIDIRNTSARVTIESTLFRHNSSVIGGGLSITGYTGTATLGFDLQVVNSVFLNNQATGGNGGGIYLAETSSNPAKVLIQSNVIGMAPSDTITFGNSASFGAGIAIQSTSHIVTMNDNLIQSNQAAELGGGIYVADAASVSISLSDILNNVGVFSGGGLMVSGNSNVTIDKSTLAGNSTINDSGTGGAIQVTNLKGSGSGFVASNSTLSSNHSSQGGGLGVWNLSTNVLFKNCTISANSATGGSTVSADGGGVWWSNANKSFSGHLSVVNSTIADNSASRGGGVFLGREQNQQTVTVNSSIVATNFGGAGRDIYYDGDTTPPLGMQIVGNRSLIGILGDGFVSVFAPQGFQSGDLGTPMDPLLHPLGYYGGPTKTHALVYDPINDKISKAIDNGSNGLFLEMDQRGHKRTITKQNPLDPLTDVGAYELQAPRVVGVLINDGSVQRSMVTSARVFFSEPVLFPLGESAGFKLEWVSGPSPGTPGVVNVDVSYDGPSRSALITFDDATYAPLVGLYQSLIDGRYRLTVVSNAVESTYDKLDGNDDGYGGPDYVLTSSKSDGIFRLFGDGEGNGAVTASDYNMFRLVYGSSIPAEAFPFDYNGDGSCTAADYNQFRLRYGVTI